MVVRHPSALPKAKRQKPKAMFGDKQMSALADYILKLR